MAVGLVALLNRHGVGTVVSTDEPVVLDSLTGRLLYGTASGVRVLVPVR
jgi:hypothetical protein